jgi:hypothetical protein
MSCVGNNYIVPSADPCNQGGGGSGVQTIVPGNAINVDSTDPLNPIVSVPKIVRDIVEGTDISIDYTDPEQPVISVAPIRVATYYKSVVQNLVNGNTDITFNLESSHNNTGGYITHVAGSTDFVVVQSGLYQLEFNTTVLLNNGTWSPTVNRSVAIDITRPSIAEQGIISSTGLQAVQTYANQTSGTIYLIAGDVINCRINNAYTLGTPTPPQAQCLTNTFDLNTWFTWIFLR